MHEPASDDIAEVLQDFDLVASSRLTYVEVRAALASSRRGRRLSRRGFTNAKATLELRWPQVDVVEVGTDLARSAGIAAERYSLRSHDALQLASALALEDREAVVVALDVRLRRAAMDSGLAIAP